MARSSMKLARESMKLVRTSLAPSGGIPAISEDDAEKGKSDALSIYKSIYVMMGRQWRRLPS